MPKKLSSTLDMVQLFKGSQSLYSKLLWLRKELPLIEGNLKIAVC